MNLSASGAFDSERLQQARLLAGMSKKELAAAIDVSPPAVSQFESGVSRPSRGTMAKLALALGVPADFFVQRAPVMCLDVGCAFFRSLRAATQAERRQAIAQASVIVDALHLLERYVRLPEFDIPRASIDHRDATAGERVALEVRAHWGLGAGPVGHVVRLMEAHGVVVSRLGLASRRVDAFSVEEEGRPIVVLGANKEDVARSRFDAAHELGHLVMHGGEEPGDPRLEREAHEFAAAFLIPSEDLIAVFPRRVSWPVLLELKKTWGVSLAMLLFRARTLSLISEAAYRRAMSTMSRNGWRKVEPGDLGPIEQPALLARAIDAYVSTGRTFEGLAAELRLPAARLSLLLGISDERVLVNVSEATSETQNSA